MQIIVFKWFIIPSMATSRFSFRALTSVLLFWSFLLLTGSGVALYIAPRCRIADQIDWRLALLAKGQWEALHTVMAVVFLVGGIFHLMRFNRRTIWVYARRSREQLSPFRWPLIIATCAVVLAVAGTIAEVPPFSTLMSIKEGFHEVWRTDEGDAHQSLQVGAADHGPEHTGEASPDRADHQVDERRGRGDGNGRMRGDAHTPDENPAAAHQPGWGRLTVAEAASRLSLTLPAALERLHKTASKLSRQTACEISPPATGAAPLTFQG